MHFLAVKPANEKLSRRQEVFWLIELAIESYWDCDKNQLKVLIDSLSVESYREAIEIA